MVDVDTAVERAMWREAETDVYRPPHEPPHECKVCHKPISEEGLCESHTEMDLQAKREHEQRVRRYDSERRRADHVEEWSNFFERGENA